MSDKIKKTFAQNSLWYAYDVEGNTPSHTFKVISQSDSQFKIERQIDNTGSSKSKPEGGVMDMIKSIASELLKELMNGGEKKTNVKAEKSPFEGKISCEFVTDNTDDEIYLPQFIHGRKREGLWAVAYPIDKDLYKEVWFKMTSTGYKIDRPSYVKKVFIIGKDRKSAEEKAKALDFEKTVNECFIPDPKTGRTTPPIVEFNSYINRNLKINAEKGDLDFLQTAVFFLPSKTTEGRNIQYNWDALSIDLIQNGETIESFNIAKGHRGRRWLERVKNTFEGHKSFSRLKPGKYQLAYKIYGQHTFFVVDFEVYTVKNPDETHELSEIYNLKAPENEYLRVEIEHNKDERNAKAVFTLSYNRLLDLIEKGKEEVLLQARLYKNGKLYGLTDEMHDPTLDARAQPDVAMKLSGAQVVLLRHYTGSGKTVFREIADKPLNEWHYIRRLQDAKYRVEYLVDGNPFAEAEFEVKNKEVIPQGLQCDDEKMSGKYIMGEERTSYIPVNYL
ncbi:hypothetical protein FUAX_42180 (plasmid) [Fulvitalea axinellae]|uniref:Uncharacterized protein n=1 Tax=Fulvitalea axinellae TaxID=1182444 RepID=A0AAU9DF69_9BACT|nr:hypothetical protein FUAX_42180 [Fulvitalea axinellae]